MTPRRVRPAFTAAALLSVALAAGSLAANELSDRDARRPAPPAALAAAGAPLERAVFALG